MKYRIATEEDVWQLAQMRWDFRLEVGEVAAFTKEEFFAVYADFFQEGLASNRHTHWLAEVDSEIVVHILVQRIDMVPRPCRLRDQYGYLTDVYTKPDYRNRGIGSQLMEKVKAWAIEEDLEIVIVWAGENAMNFYKRHESAPNGEILELKIRGY